MGSLNLSSAEIAALQNSPALLVGAINDLLGQARFLSAHYRVLTGQIIGADIPEAVTQPAAVIPAGIEYGPNGLTAPRADGAVRSKAWDDALAAARDSSDPVKSAWANSPERGPWILIQDTLKLPDLTETQRATVAMNCSTCRFVNGGGPAGKYSAYKASPVTSDRSGPRLADAEITDAFCTPSDMAYQNGEIVWVGLWAKDLARYAEKSLAHFVLTSGAAVLRALGQ